MSHVEVLAGNLARGVPLMELCVRALIADTAGPGPCFFPAFFDSLSLKVGADGVRSSGQFKARLPTLATSAAANRNTQPIKEARHDGYRESYQTIDHGCLLSGAPAFQFYPGDFDQSTKFLSAAATGAHIRMMCASWEHGPIVNTEIALQKAMGLVPNDPPFSTVWGELKPRWKLTKSGWIHRRLEKTRRAQDEFRRKMQKAGRKSAKNRHDKSNQVEARLQPSSNVGANVDPNLKATLRSSISDLRSLDQKHTKAADAAAFRDLWNAHRSALMPQCLKVGDGRGKAINARLADRPLGEWAPIIDRIAASDFCNGLTPRGNWVATIDWLLKPDTATRILEGQYDNRKPKAEAQPFHITGPTRMWTDECEELHAGSCKDSWTHGTRMASERAAS